MAVTINSRNAVINEINGAFGLTAIYSINTLLAVAKEEEEEGDSRSGLQHGDILQRKRLPKEEALHKQPTESILMII